METVHHFTILRRAHDGHLATKWSRRENTYVQRDMPTCRAECLRAIRRREARPMAAHNADRVTIKSVLEASASRKLLSLDEKGGR